MSSKSRHSAPVAAVFTAAALLGACAHAPVATFAPPPQLAPPAAGPGVHVEHVPDRDKVLVVAGPFHVPASGPGHAHEDRTPLLEFDWPVDAAVRGFRITLYDAHGRALPRDLMHHLIAYNFSRRQLIHPGVERLFGIGRETADVMLPRTAGVPVDAGSRLGFDAVWHNEMGVDVHDVYVRIALHYVPADRRIAYAGFPFHVDVNYAVGGSNEFDIPPGRSRQMVEFVMPIDGGLIGVGGHLHEHGVGLQLEDAETGRVLFRLRARPDPVTKVAVEQRVFRTWLGLRSARLPLEAGRRYRLTSEYYNPTGAVIERGAMAHIAGLFVPADATQWPALDVDEPDIRRDILVLRGVLPRAAGAGHHHHHHD